MKIPILMKHKTNLKGWKKRRGAQAHLWRHPSVGSRLSSHQPLLTSMSCHTKVRNLYDLFSEEDLQGNNLVLGWMPWEKHVPCCVISTDSCKIQDNQIQHFREYTWLQLEIEKASPGNMSFSKCNWMPSNTVGFFVSTYCHHCETYKGFLGDLKWSPSKMIFFMLLLVLQKWILIVNL